LAHKDFSLVYSTTQRPIFISIRWEKVFLSATQTPQQESKYVSILIRVFFDFEISVIRHWCFN